MLSNILLGLGLIGTALGLLNFFLDDAQRNRITDKVQNAWNWIDDLSKRPKVDVLRNRIVQWSIACAASAITAALILIPFWGSSLLYLVTFLLVGFAVIAPTMIGFAVRPNSPAMIAVRTVGIVVALLVGIDVLIRLYGYFWPRRLTGNYLDMVPTNAEFAIIVAAVYIVIALALTLAPLVLILTAKILLSALESPGG